MGMFATDSRRDDATGLAQFSRHEPLRLLRVHVSSGKCTFGNAGGFQLPPIGTQRREPITAKLHLTEDYRHRKTAQIALRANTTIETLEGATFLVFHSSRASRASLNSCCCEPSRSSCTEISCLWLPGMT